MIGRIANLVRLGAWPVPNQTVTGIAAAGADQPGATLLTGDFNIVATSTATSADGVRMPKAQRGDVVFVYNDSANTVSIWPAKGEKINNLADDAEYTGLTTKKGALLVAASDTRWLVFLSV